jgi:hypothetical protein
LENVIAISIGLIALTISINNYIRSHKPKVKLLKFSTGYSSIISSEYLEVIIQNVGITLSDVSLWLKIKNKKTTFSREFSRMSNHFQNIQNSSLAKGDIIRYVITSWEPMDISPADIALEVRSNLLEFTILSIPIRRGIGIFFQMQKIKWNQYLLPIRWIADRMKEKKSATLTLILRDINNKILTYFGFTHYQKLSYFNRPKLPHLVPSILSEYPRQECVK